MLESYPTFWGFVFRMIPGPLPLKNLVLGVSGIGLEEFLISSMLANIFMIPHAAATADDFEAVAGAIRQGEQPDMKVHPFNKYTVYASGCLFVLGYL